MEKNGFFNRLKTGLAKTRNVLTKNLDNLVFGKKVIDKELFGELEELLITADMGPQFAHVLIDDVKEKISRQELGNARQIKKILRERMEELKKVKKVIGKELAGAPHEILLVLDATTGQNAVIQAKMFKEEIGVTGIVLTKLDGTAKGVVVIRIVNELALPVRYIGVGEGLDDLRIFDSNDFVAALLD